MKRMETFAMQTRTQDDTTSIRNKCYKGKNEWKEIDFTKDQLKKPCRNFLTRCRKVVETSQVRSKGVLEKVKIVNPFLRPVAEKCHTGYACQSLHSVHQAKHWESSASC